MLSNEQISTLAQASAAAYEYGTAGNQIGNYKLIKQFPSDGDGDPTGFHARIYVDDDNHYIVSLTGTELSAKDGFADANLGLPQYTNEAGGKALLGWIEKNIPDGGCIDITGHSLGGALAQYLAYDLASPNSTSSYQLSLVTFNALGGVQGEQELAGENYDTARLNNVDVMNYVNKGDGVSLLGDGHLGGNTYQLDAGSENVFAAHGIANFTGVSDFSTAVPVSLNYFQIDNAQSIAALCSSIATGQSYTEPEAFMRLLGGVTLALISAPESELNQIYSTFANDFVWPWCRDLPVGQIRDAAIAALPELTGTTAIAAASLIGIAVISQTARAGLDSAQGIAADYIPKFVDTISGLADSGKLAYEQATAAGGGLADTAEASYKSIVASVADGMATAANAIQNTLASTENASGEVVQTLISSAEKISQTENSLLGEAAALGDTVCDSVKSSVEAAIQSTGDGLDTAASIVRDTLSAAHDLSAPEIQSLVETAGRIQDLSASTYSQAVAIGGELAESAQPLYESTISSIASGIDTAARYCQDGLGTAENIGSDLLNSTAQLINQISTTSRSLVDDAAQLGEETKQIVSDTYDSVSSAAVNVYDKIVDVVSDRIADAGSLYEGAKDTISDFAKGFSQKFDEVKEAAGQDLSTLKDWALGGLQTLADLVSGTANAATRSMDDDGKGNVEIKAVDSNGNILLDAWQKENGSHGDDAFLPNNANSGSIYNADGSSSVWQNNGRGTLSTMTVDADNSRTITVASDDGSGSVEKYNASGQLTSQSETDMFGAVTTTVYDGEDSTTYRPDGSIVQTLSDAGGTTTTTTLDVDGSSSVVTTGQYGVVQTETETNADGSSHSKAYWPDGSLKQESTVNADGSSFSVEKDTFGTVLSTVSVDENGTTTTNYRPGGTIESEVTRDDEGNTTTTQYGWNNQPTDRQETFEDGSHSDTKYYDDGSVQQQVTLNSDGSKVVSQYSSDGTQWSTVETDPDGKKTATTYSNGDNATYLQTIYPDGSHSEWTFSLNGLLLNKTTTQSDGTTSYQTVQFYSDGSAHETSKDFDGSTSSTDRDANGNIIGESFKDGHGVGWAKTYAADGSLATSTTFNADGSSSGVINGSQGSVTTWSRNADGSGWERYVDGLDSRNDWYTEWGPTGTLVYPEPHSDKVTMRDGSTVVTNYDKNDVVTSIVTTRLDGSSEEKDYLHGILSTVTASRYTETYTYTAGAFLSNPNITYCPWDVNSTSWLCSVTPATYQATYNVNGKIVSQNMTFGDGSTCSMSFFADGTLASESFVNNQGSGNQLKSGHAEYLANGAWKLTSYVEMNGNRDSRTYYANGQLADETRVDVAGTYHAHYSADGSQKTISQTDRPDGTSEYWSTNALGVNSHRLVQADGSSETDTNDSHGNVETIDYDAAGNKTMRQWQRSDGSSGKDWYALDGSSHGTALINQAVTSVYQDYTDDGHGNKITTTYGANDVKISVVWQKEDGSSGTDSFNPDGTTTGTVTLPNGSRYGYADDGKGLVTYQYYFNGAGDIEIPDAGSENRCLSLSPSTRLADLQVTAALGSDGAPALVLQMDGQRRLILDHGFEGSADQFVMGDGSRLSLNDLLSRATIVPATVPTAGGNLIFDGRGHTTLTGGSGADTIYGWNGYDTLVAGDGATTLIGGSGNDTFVVKHANDVADERSPTVGINTVIASVNYSMADQAKNVSNLTLTGSGDLMGTGNSLDNVIKANDGNDTLDGGGGNDTLIGGAGRDTFVFRRNSGVDTVIDDSSLGGIVQLADGLPVSDVLATRSGNDLQLKIVGSSSGAMLIKDYFVNAPANWTIQDTAGVVTPLQAALDTTTGAPLASRMAQLEDAFVAQVKADIPQSFDNATYGYAVQADGSYLSRDLYTTNPYYYSGYGWTNAGSRVEEIRGAYGALSVQHQVSYLDGTTSNYVSQVSQNDAVHYDDQNYVFNNSISIQETWTTVDDTTTVVNESPTSSYDTYDQDWTRVNWSQGYLNSGESTQTVAVTDSQGKIIGYDQQIIAPVGSLSSNSPYDIEEYGYATGDLLTNLGPHQDTTSAFAPYVPVDFVHHHITDNIERIYLGEGDHTVDANSWDVVNGGPGHDVIRNAGFVYTGTGDDTVINAGTVYAGSGNNEIDNATLAYGGTGNDTMVGGGTLVAGTGNDVLIGGTVMAAGSGNDRIFAGNQATTIQIDPNSVGTAILGGAGATPMQALDAYYRSQGVTNWQFGYQYGGTNVYLLNCYCDESGSSGLYSDASEPLAIVKQNGYGDWTLQQALDRRLILVEAIAPLSVLVAFDQNPLSPSPYYQATGIPTTHLSANDFASLQPLYGNLPSHQVVFGSGVALSNLQYSWGQTTTAMDGQGTASLHTTLNISWGTGHELQVVIPHYSDAIGSSITNFKFADGSTISLGDMIALAPPAPTFDPQCTQFQTGMGTVSVNAGDLGEAIKFSADLIPGSVACSRDGKDLILSDAAAGGSDTLRVVDWFSNPSAMPSVAAVFADGVRWSAAQLTTDGLALDGRTGNQTLTGLDGFANVLYGGPGDTLVGGHGDQSSNTFVFSLGGGQTTVMDDAKDGAGSGDVIQFGAGITIANTRFIVQGSDLQIVYGLHGDSVLIKNFAPNGLANRQVIGQFLFADGSHGSFGTDASGNNTVIAYDASGVQVGSFVDYGSYVRNTVLTADGSTRYYYPPYGYYTVSSTTSHPEATTRRQFDGDGNLLYTTANLTDAQGDDWMTTDYVDGRRDTYENVTDANGTQRTSTASYDAAGNVTRSYEQVKQPDGSLTQHVLYDDGTAHDYSVDAAGNALWKNYDTTGREVSESWQHSDGSSQDTTFNVDGSAQVIKNDGQGDRTTANYDASGVLRGDAWSHVDGTYGTDVFNSDGSSEKTLHAVDGTYQVIDDDGRGSVTTRHYLADGTNDWTSSPNTIINPDGSRQTTEDDGRGNVVVTNYDASGARVSDSWSHSDGTRGNDIFHSDGSRQTTEDDGHGNVVTTDYDPLGVRVSDSWSHSDGTRGNDVFHSDGSSQKTSDAADGSYQTIIDDGQGDVTTTNYGASGTRLGDVWNHVDGTHGTDTFNADGSSAGLIIAADGSYQNTTDDGQGNRTTYDYSSSNIETGYSTQNADGSHASATYNADGSLHAQIYNADGSYTVDDNNGVGTDQTQDFDASGNLLDTRVTTLSADGRTRRYDSWTTPTGAYGTDTFNSADVETGSTYHNPDGSYGSETYDTDNSRSGVDYASDGSYRSYSDDGMGNQSLQSHAADGTVIGDSWRHADGTYGQDTFNADGSSDKRFIAADGSYRITDDDGQGHVTTTRYNADGSVDTSGNDSSDGVTTYNPDGSYSVQSDDGHGYVLTTDYDPAGVRTGDHWTRSDNTAGYDTYNADGSSIAVSYRADGGYSYTTDNGQGGIVATRFGADGSTKEETFLNPDGSTQAETFNTDGSIDQVITPGDGSITTQHMVYGTDGSWQQTWQKSDGSYGNDTANADGSSSGATYYANGSHSEYSGDAQHNVVTRSFDTSGNEVQDDYQYADGSTDRRTFNADGTVASSTTTPNAAGGYTARNDDGHGNVVTMQFGAAGDFQQETFQNADGSQNVWVEGGNRLFLGSAQSDYISGGAGNNILIGGTGDDQITTGDGSNVIAFNTGDGQDTIDDAAGQNNTLSLGGHFAYSDLSLQSEGNDLVLNVGNGDSVTLKDWYASPANQNIVTLQVIAEDMPDFAAGSSDILRNSKVETFDFRALVSEFDQARGGSSMASQWSLTNALLDTHLASSDGTALGGDLAYEYGQRGSLAGFGMAAAGTVLSDPNCAVAPQALQPWGTVATGANTLK